VAGRIEHSIISDVPSRNTQADCFEDRGLEFNANNNDGGGGGDEDDDNDEDDDDYNNNDSNVLVIFQTLCH
jgi:hypothetical protein